MAAAAHRDRREAALRPGQGSPGGRRPAPGGQAHRRRPATRSPDADAVGPAADRSTQRPGSRQPAGTAGRGAGRASGAGRETSPQWPSQPAPGPAPETNGPGTAHAGPRIPVPGLDEAAAAREPASSGSRPPGEAAATARTPPAPGIGKHPAGPGPHRARPGSDAQAGPWQPRPIRDDPASAPARLRGTLPLGPAARQAETTDWREAMIEKGRQEWQPKVVQPDGAFPRPPQAKGPEIGS